MTFGSNDFIENSSGWNLFDRKLLALTDNLTDYKPISYIIHDGQNDFRFLNFFETMISHVTKTADGNRPFSRTVHFPGPSIFSNGKNKPIPKPSKVSTISINVKILNILHFLE